MKTVIRRRELLERWGCSPDVLESMITDGTLHPRNKIMRGTFLLSEVEAIENEGIETAPMQDARKLERVIALQQEKIAFLEGKIAQLREVLAV